MSIKAIIYLIGAVIIQGMIGNGLKGIIGFMIVLSLPFITDEISLKKSIQNIKDSQKEKDQI